MKAAKTRALHKKHPVHAHHGGAVAKKPAAKAKKAPKATAAKKAPVRRTAAQVKAAHLRAWSPGGVSCCAAEAVAASLRLTGRPVPPADVVDLFWLAGGDPEAGMPIPAALEAAAEYGLAGIRPVSFGPVDLDDPAAVILGLDLPEAPHAVALDPSGAVWSWGGLYDLTADAVIAEAWAVEWQLAPRLHRPAYSVSEV